MERRQQLQTWLTQEFPGRPFELAPASADASFRRYFRITFQDDGSTLIAMDAPPAVEDCGHYADLARRFRAIGLNTPEIHAEDREQGFLLISDLGDRVYLSQLNDQTADDLYADALEALATAAWPGNVRQLYNVVEQSCALTATPLIPLTLVKRALRIPALEALSYYEAKQRFERNYLVQLLKLTEGNVADAARIADRNRTEFYRLLQKYDLTPAMFRGDGDAAPE